MLLVEKNQINKLLDSLKPKKNKAEEMFNQAQLDVVTKLVAKEQIKSALEELKRHQPILPPVYYASRKSILTRELNNLDQKQTEKINLTIQVG